MSHKVETITQVAFIPASPQAVYEGFLSGKTHALMTGAGASSEANVGGQFSAWDGYIFGKHLVLESNQKIVDEWQTTEWPDGYPPSRLELIFEADGEGTKVTLTQTDVPAEQVADYEQGWHDYYWEPMRQYFGQQT